MKKKSPDEESPNRGFSVYEVRNQKNTKRCPHQHRELQEAHACARTYQRAWGTVVVWRVSFLAVSTLQGRRRKPRCITCHQTLGADLVDPPVSST